MGAFGAGVKIRERIIANESKIIQGNAISSGGDQKVETLQSIFGLPPDNFIAETNRKILDSMPICHFFPSIPDFTRGIDLFTLKPAWSINTSGGFKLENPSYLKLLDTHGFKTPNSVGQGIKVAYLADSFPTDTFTNEYGENFLQSLTDVSSEKAASIAQFMGTRTATEAISKLLGPISKAAAGAAGKLPGGQEIFDFVKGGAEGAINIAKAGISAANLGGAAGIINRLAAGARIDFPMVWKSSGFQPSYTMTIRLYNPNPRSVRDTRKYIAGPLTALMLLAVPISVDGSTYSWPFFHRIVSPGIFDLNPGFIANITVIKGGDQQQISQQQRLGIVDVRIDVGSLFSSMIAGTSNVNQKTRPTVQKYINNLLNPNPGRHQVYDRQGILKKDEINQISRIQTNAIRNAGRVDNTRRGADIPGTKEDSSTTPRDRVNSTIKTIGDRLGELLPEGFRIDVDT